MGIGKEEADTEQETKDLEVEKWKRGGFCNTRLFCVLFRIEEQRKSLWDILYPSE